KTPLSVTDGKDDNLLEETGFIKKLVRASEGNEVKEVQSKLKDLGFFDGPISGYYMNQTIAAVKKFQEFNGLHITGETDEQTWNALFSKYGVVDINSTPAPTPEPILPKYAITIDVKNQAVLVYEKNENGEYKNLVRTMVCSTGLVSTPSEVGEWVLTGRKANWCYFPAYGSHAKYWTMINKYIAFHSVIYNSVNNMALSVKSYNKLGSRASHGCVRLLVSDAKWIYDNIEAGTVVTITEDLPLDEELRHSLKVPPLNKKNMLPVRTPEPTAAPNYSADGIPPLPLEKLKKGMSGEAVYWLQSKLKDLGFYTGTVTGTYLSGTQNAVKKYQAFHSLYQTGEADVDLLNILYADVLNPVTLEPQSTPVPIQIVEPTPQITKNP
ncbi:MAG: L,D-transpeptidase family protein, partial [Christensenellaceae bacterium]|nr:L,D-transpeptidase family protein [Christensenellaceae bacterium]